MHGPDHELWHPLVAALWANSIEEFLADPEVTGTALRDVCSKLDSPRLQEVCDACADLFQTEEPEEVHTPMGGVKDNHDHEESLGRKFKWPKEKGDLPDKWISKREKANVANVAKKEAMDAPFIEALFRNVGSRAIEFGGMQQTPTQKKIRAKTCGRTIWYYPSDKALSRGIIARDSKLQDVVSFCRH